MLTAEYHRIISNTTGGLAVKIAENSSQTDVPTTGPTTSSASYAAVST